MEYSFLVFIMHSIMFCKNTKKSSRGWSEYDIMVRDVGSNPHIYSNEICRGGIMIREIVENDFDNLLRLYMQLHDNPFPEKNERVLAVWNSILNDKNHHIIVAEESGVIVSSCVCVIIPNLTRGQRPYAFIENVITDENYRKMGYATACLNFAREIAKMENCYKIMLLTGSKQKSTLDFYEQAGYNHNDKTAFIQWL